MRRKIRAHFRIVDMAGSLFGFQDSTRSVAVTHRQDGYRA
jgi:hypothetical protein